MPPSAHFLTGCQHLIFHGGTFVNIAGNCNLNPMLFLEKSRSSDSDDDPGDPYDNLIWEPLFAGISTEILSRNSNLVQVIGLLLVLQVPQQAAGIEDILDWEAGKVLSTLSSVHFLVDLNINGDGDIDIRHGRPRDWLMDRARPGRYRIEVLQYEKHERVLVHQCFSVIPRYLCKAWSGEPHREPDYGFTIYILHYLSFHYFASESRLNKQMIVNDLQSFEINFWANPDGNHQFPGLILDHIRAVAHVIEDILIRDTRRIYLDERFSSKLYFTLQERRLDNIIFEDELFLIYRGYWSIIHHICHQFVSQSCDLQQLIHSFPGFQSLKHITVDGLAELFGVDYRLTDSLTSKCRMFFRAFADDPYIQLHPSLAYFLGEKPLSGVYFREPRKNHAEIAYRCGTLLRRHAPDSMARGCVPKFNVDDSDGVRYATLFLKHHLCESE